MKKVVITGGSYSGKTKLINTIAQNGFNIVPEAAIEVIKELNEKLGLERQKKWRTENVDKFQIEIIKRKISLEKSCHEGLYFCDRGVFDSIAYLRFSNRKIPLIISNITKNHHYDLVFILDTLKNFVIRKDEGRKSSREDSLKQNSLLYKVYTETRMLSNPPGVGIKSRTKPPLSSK